MKTVYFDLPKANGEPSETQLNREPTEKMPENSMFAGIESQNKAGRKIRRT
ncbi:MAG: hypothetical protein WC139_01160 [Candidatus Kapaibacterium sp.]